MARQLILSYSGAWRYCLNQKEKDLMKLAEFIRQNVEEISIEWKKFASTLLPNEDFSKSALRDGIKSEDIPTRMRLPAGTYRLCGTNLEENRSVKLVILVFFQELGIYWTLLNLRLADREGFEPSIGLHLY